MSAAKSLLILALLACMAVAQPPRDVRLLFTGDILLSRQTRREIEASHRFPWTGFASLFRNADWVAGNLEGAVGDAQQCTPRESQSPCFDIPVTLIPLLGKAGFRAVSVANNHALDLGLPGRETTEKALRDTGLLALSEQDSPHFVKVGPWTMAIVAMNLVPSRDGSRDEIPSLEMRQKLRLARHLADLVVVSVHWGSELLEWPSDPQRDAAKWLVENGADLIVGHHPHVVQPPECVDGRPVFFSLGNHLFDQKYPATKEGLIADCRIQGATLRCSGIPTRTPVGSSYPAIAGAAPPLRSCDVALEAPSAAGFLLHGTPAPDHRYWIEGSRAGRRPWRSTTMRLVSVESGRLAGADGPDYLLTFERHHSSIDDEDGLRPYVYEIHDAGLIARWRGSALAWPLLDAALLPHSDGVVCALHRSDSFIELQPGTAGTRVAAYRWNGFGFSGVDDAAIIECCRPLFDREPRESP